MYLSKFGVCYKETKNWLELQVYSEMGVTKYCHYGCNSGIAQQWSARIPTARLGFKPQSWRALVIKSSTQKQVSPWGGALILNPSRWSMISRNWLKKGDYLTRQLPRNREDIIMDIGWCDGVVSLWGGAPILTPNRLTMRWSANTDPSLWGGVLILTHTVSLWGRVVILTPNGLTMRRSGDTHPKRFHYEVERWYWPKRSHYEVFSTATTWFETLIILGPPRCEYSPITLFVALNKSSFTKRQNVDRDNPTLDHNW